jgi:hypothetical protein
MFGGLSVFIVYKIYLKRTDIVHSGENVAKKQRNVVATQIPALQYIGVLNIGVLKS